jgi:hypothetical protein
VLREVRAMQSNCQPWPVTLKHSISLKDLQKALRRDQSAKEFDIDLLEAVRKEQILRIEKLCNFLSQYDHTYLLGSRLPTTEDEWCQLVIVLCEFLNVPAFQVQMTKPRGPGASKLWTDNKLCQLFADVQSLTKSSALSENGACKFIAANPQKFGNRYRPSKPSTPLARAKTLHRQFTAIKLILKTKRTFRIWMLRGIGREFEYGPAFVDEAIKRYAFARELSR